MSVVRAEAELSKLLVLELFLAMAEQTDAEVEESQAHEAMREHGGLQSVGCRTLPMHARGLPMSHADDRGGLALAPETQSRIDELFAGQTCHRCGGPAERLVRERFYCVSHFLRKQPRAAGPPRVYRCSAA